ncbi:hypothetical protein V5O48_012884 [Marasmius crinis-equi]|uniref:SWIM-type domain-containing protein n=1 Tax=Marasmius crinis-equi TaxID=585013 RepID=A0ABR3F1K9_9AGAR
MNQRNASSHNQVTSRASGALWDGLAQHLQRGDMGVRREEAHSAWSEVGARGRGGMHSQIHRDSSAVAEVWTNWNQPRSDGIAGIGKKRDSPMKKPRAPRTQTGSHRRKRPRKESTGEGSVEGPNHDRTVLEGDDVHSEAEIRSNWDEPGMDGDEWNMEDTAVEDEDLDAFMAQFQAGNVGFIPIGTYLYAVQGWNKAQQEPVNRWFHFQVTREGEDVHITCTCSDGEKHGSCVHKRFLQLERMVFRVSYEVFLTLDGRVVWFWREKENDDGRNHVIWFNQFSVLVGDRERVGLNGQAMVTHLGSDMGSGIWKCSKCSGKCAHTSAAHRFLDQVMGRDGEDAEGENNDDAIAMFEDKNMDVRPSENAISFLPVMPPRWAALPTDLLHYARVQGNNGITSQICLTQANRSPCGRERAELPDQGVVVKPCTVYTITGRLTRDIELVPCPVCPSRKHCFIGPDPRNLGLFNFNNSVLFTHELLDDYTSRYTSSETPFAAFVEVMGRLYEGRGESFVKEDLFWSVWFAYVNIQDFSYDMACGKCGDEPDCLIWDGVTLAFGQKHALDTLRPPTRMHESAPKRYRQFPKKPQLIQQIQKAPIRRPMKQWIQGSSKKRAAKPKESDESGVNDVDEPPLHGEQFQLVLGRLLLVSKELAMVFKRTFAVDAVIDARRKKLYGTLFEQVGAEESALQMIIPRTLPKLRVFAEDPRWETASQLREIPALYHVLEAESKTSGTYLRDLVDLCGWLYRRTSQVLGEIVQHDKRTLPEAGNDLQEAPFSDDWKQVSAYMLRVLTVKQTLR